MYVSINADGILVRYAAQAFHTSGERVLRTNMTAGQLDALLGTKVIGKTEKQVADLRVAVVCNWNDSCGISTYSKLLVDAITPKVKEVKIFSEDVKCPTNETNNYNVERNWKRGLSMHFCLQSLNKWKPDYVIVQHEYGIFPNAVYFLTFLQGLETYKYVITLHSVYRHMDKAVCSAAIKNIVVHTEQGKSVLEELGHVGNIFVVPHGCVKFTETERLWNIFHSDHTLVQFGFGFSYKGVDRAIQAIALLKNKYPDIFYCYLCSDTSHWSGVHEDYYNYLMREIDEFGLHNNVAIIKKYHSDETINAYLRTAKVALFPYLVQPGHQVWGASGAVRIAMANRTPTIVSASSQFDDLEGTLPRPGTVAELAEEIDRVFADPDYTKQIVLRSDKYIDENTWDMTADRYLALASLI